MSCPFIEEIFSFHATSLICNFFRFQASQDKKSLDVGANLFIGNLDPVSHPIMQVLNWLMQLCIKVET